MELLILLLATMLAASIAWIARLRQQLRSAQPSSDPQPPGFDELFGTLLPAFDAGVAVIDSDRFVRSLNRQLEELVNLPRDAIINRGVIALIRDHQADEMIARSLHDGETREMILQPLGNRRMLRLRVTSFSVQDRAGAILLIRDMTQLSMLERARRDMVANVSHELRTPLASVKLLVETLQTNPPPPIAQRMLGHMAQEVDAITQLVNELHELSQIESGRVALHLTPHPLGPIVNRALERIQPQAIRKQLQIEAFLADDLPLILVDEERIGQVLLNLLHNAVKFTGEQGRIHITAAVMEASTGNPRNGVLDAQYDCLTTNELYRRVLPPVAATTSVTLPNEHAAGSWLLVGVSDTGIGIPSQDLPRIFERFYKVDRARTRNSGGTGLGLAIAKHLIEGHGGKIWALSREGIGSVFLLTLPIA